MICQTTPTTPEMALKPKQSFAAQPPMSPAIAGRMIAAGIAVSAELKLPTVTDGSFPTIWTKTEFQSDVGHRNVNHNFQNFH